MKPAIHEPPRPDEDQPEPVTPDVERMVRERLADAGPTRPWDEFYADEKKRTTQPPMAR
jgi:hypothetical protein